MPPKRRSPLPWPSLALWLAIGIVALRGAVRIADGRARGLDLAGAGWDFGQDLFPVLCTALGAALIGLSPARYPGPMRTLRLTLSAALLAYVLGGTHLEPAHARIWHEPWPFALAVVPLGLALAFVLRQLAAVPRPLSASISSAAGTGLPAIVGALLAGFYGWTFVRHAPTVESRAIGRELFADADAWHVTQQRPETSATPRLEMLAPEYRSEDARPTIVMPPPATVELPIGASDDRCSLFGEVAIHIETARAADEQPLTIRFQVHVGDELRFDASVAATTRRWTPIVDAQTHEPGIEVGPGDVVRLSTAVVGELPDGLAPEAVLCGFGKLRLETREARAWQRASPDLPNLVLIVQDTQRADRLGCYGYEQDTSPALDALAARGLLFEEAFATSSWTWPSTASILTGELPERHGVTSNKSCYLFGAETTIAEALRGRGYLTAAFTCNPLIVDQQNFDQGFDDFACASEFRKTDEILPDVLNWLREHHAGRFFLYLHLADPHEPHRPLPQFAEQFGVRAPADLPYAPGTERDPEQAFNIATKNVNDPTHYDAHGELLPAWRVPAEHQRFYQASYDASVASGDHWVGQILAELESLGLGRTTVIAYTSDHGEELFDHDRLAHGHTLYRELVHVPLVVAGPGIPTGVRVTEPVSNRDLYGMLARLGGVPLEGQGARLELGSSGEAVLFSTDKGWWNGFKSQKVFGIRSRDWAYHAAPQAGPWGAGPQERTGDERLFDVNDDPLELRNVVANNPDTRDTLLAAVKSQLREAQRARTSAALRADPSMDEMLEELGYLEGLEDEDGDE